LHLSLSKTPVVCALLRFIMIEHKCGPNQDCLNQLLLLCLKNNIKAIKQLLEDQKYPNIVTANCKSISPLHLAIKLGHTQVVETFLKQASIKNIDHSFYLVEAFAAGYDSIIETLLVAFIKDVDILALRHSSVGGNHGMQNVRNYQRKGPSSF
jgi:ankyrin repeat protein